MINGFWYLVFALYGEAEEEASTYDERERKLLSTAADLHHRTGGPQPTGARYLTSQPGADEREVATEATSTTFIMIIIMITTMLMMININMRVRATRKMKIRAQKLAFYCTWAC